MGSREKCSVCIPVCDQDFILNIYLGTISRYIYLGGIHTLLFPRNQKNVASRTEFLPLYHAAVGL
jgi:hypothetical protein